MTTANKTCLKHIVLFKVSPRRPLAPKRLSVFAFRRSCGLRRSLFQYESCQVCILFSSLGQTMQQFFWQEDMQSVLHFIQVFVCVLLPASVVDDSSNQP